MIMPAKALEGLDQLALEEGASELFLEQGVFLLLASALAGLVWDRYGSPATFLTGAGFSAVAMAGLLFYRR